jgi:hypothetical protein
MMKKRLKKNNFFNHYFFNKFFYLEVYKNQFKADKFFNTKREINTLNVGLINPELKYES